MSEIAISIKNISKTFVRNKKSQVSIKKLIQRAFSSKEADQEFFALKNINLEIPKGEVFGIIGRNGSGKSTLMNIIIGALHPNKNGEVITNGKIMKLSLGIGVDANLTARENIYLNGSIIGLSFKDIGNKFKGIIEFAGLEEFVDTQIKYYSRGMRSRLLFSIAIHANADIFLLDEFFGGVGDKDFRQKSEKIFSDNIIDKKTIIIVSHSIDIILNHCTRVLWLSKGEMKMLGDTKEVVAAYEASFPALKR